MNSKFTAPILTLSVFISGVSYSQTLFAPNGTLGATPSGNSNVGIGTGSPAFRLDVSHDNYNAMRVAGNSSNAIGIYISNTATNARTWALTSSGGGPAPAGNFVLWDESASAVRMTVNSSGNVGIGTTNPFAALTVKGKTSVGTGTAQNAFLSSDTQFQILTDQGVAAQMAFWQSGVAGSYIGHKANDSDFYLTNTFDGSALGTANRSITLTSSGSVGIGITTPTARLDVVGDGSATGIINARSRQTNTYLTLTAGTADDAVGEFAFERTGVSAGNIYIGGNATGNIIFRSGGYTHRMGITSIGDVGVGTANPKGKLGISLNNDDQIVFSSLADNQLSIQTTLDGQPLGTYGGPNGQLFLQPYVGNVLLVTGGGNVGIGTASPTHRLSVNGTIRTKEVIVDTGWADYVFADGYRLAPLSEVEAHIEREKHLPGVPSAQQIAEEGLSVGEMQSLLLAKIEELTLHVIRIEKDNSKLRERVRGLEEDLAKM